MKRRRVPSGENIGRKFCPTPFVGFSIVPA
jgi:hypothetical protein